MKPIAALAGFVYWLMAEQTIAQSGLKGEYYKGTNFEQKILTRIDPQIQFNWAEGSPAPGLPHSYYSIRWTGKLLAPATGQYGFFAKVDDGIRVWVGNKKVMDSWQLNDSQNYSGSIELEAGHFYDLRVDYFNDMLEGEIELYWQLPSAKKVFTSRFSPPGNLITAQYFFQKALPPSRITLIKKPPKPVVTTPVATPTAPKPLPKKRLPIAAPKPVITLPSPKSIAVADTVAALPVPTRKPTLQPPSEIKSGTTFTLPNVQFEQSSYVLLSESSTDLDKLVLAMKANPNWHVSVAGHTDNVGDPRLNLALSENRAKVVANYLIRRGIDDNRVTTTGYGGTRPVANNALESERRKNRRVEFTIQ